MKTIPNEILTQHVAVLGKTGSGKTSTAKLAIEQVVAGGARVCVLDPIKSDWWGLTSSADGKRAGLPFHILGGPRGHVPLHSSAGKAIGEIVANATLPLSIIDMADFEPGGQAKFFIDFAPTLLKKMRGVVYLVIEEAHLFAPKERSGIGQENLSIHWAKTLATAGRSKGVRLFVVTQRTQALHNALLGSCDTVIAHRLTAPADQEPVVKWLKANTSKEILERVSSTLASLKTGDGWICSGEAKIFEQVHFARISTYDNTATPTGDGETRDVKTAPVDQDKLRAIIGDAVEQAKSDDPRELRKQLAAQKVELGKLQAEINRPVKSLPGGKTLTTEIREKPVLTDADRALLQKVAIALADREQAAHEQHVAAESRLDQRVQSAVAEYVNTVRTVGLEISKEIAVILERVGFTKVLEKLERVSVTPAPSVKTQQNYSKIITRSPQQSVAKPFRPSQVTPSNGDVVEGMKGGKFRAMLVALAQAGRPLSDTQIAARAVMSLSGTFDKYLGIQRANGWVEGARAALAITNAGIDALGHFDQLPTGEDLQNHWLSELGNGKASEMLRVLIAAYPSTLADSDVADRAAMALSGTFDKYLGNLRRLRLVDGKRDSLRASDELFEA